MSTGDEGAPPRRFRDPGHRLVEVWGEILIVCPRCAGCARTVRCDSADEALLAPRRLVCACGHLEERTGGSVVTSTSAPVDGHFGRPLWLQAPCAGHTVWAFNAAHLALLEQFIGARLRERRRDATTGWQNRSLLGRLPRWMQAAKNRGAVLRALGTLRARLPEGAA